MRFRREHRPPTARMGVSIVELLVALAILSIVLSLVAGAVSVSGRAYRTSDSVTQREELTSAVRQLISYDLGLAGYRCADAGAATREFTSPPLAVGANEIAEYGQEFFFAYFEDRYSGACTQVVVVYYIEDGGDRPVLMRSETVGADPEVVSEVAVGANRLQVYRYYDSSGIARQNLGSGDIGSMSVEVGFDWDSGTRFVVATPNLVTYQ